MTIRAMTPRRRADSPGQAAQQMVKTAPDGAKAVPASDTQCFVTKVVDGQSLAPF